MGAFFGKMLLFFVFQEKKEISRPPPAPASEYYAKTPSTNGPTHLPDRTLVPSARSFVLLGWEKKQLLAALRAAPEPRSTDALQCQAQRGKRETDPF